MLTRSDKESMVGELREKFSRATSVFVAEYRGLDVGRIDSLRRKLRAEPAGAYEYRVTKNTLLRRAAAGSGVETIVQHFKGPTAVAIGFGDPVRLAKILVDYAKDNEIFQLRGAMLDGKALGKADIATLATLPSLDELRSRLIGLLQAPAGQIARIAAEPAAQLARVIAARGKALEEAGAASA